MVVFPNAKINIGLNIVGKREDGFHNIESIFVPVNLYDVLEFVESDDNKTSFQTSGIKIPGKPEENLCIRAWEILHSTYKIPKVQIHLHKNIPIGAGLGGGSADAAFMLTALNTYFNLNLSSLELKHYSAELGSDCPFFIDNKPCYVTGRGEVLDPIEFNLKGLKILLVFPDIHISTKEAYSGITIRKSTAKLTESIIQPLEIWKTVIKNDFEESVFPKYKLLAEIKNEITSMGALYSSMTGSGSCIYGLFNEDSEIASTMLLQNNHTIIYP